MTQNVESEQKMKKSKKSKKSDCTDLLQAILTQALSIEAKLDKARKEVLRLEKKRSEVFDKIKYLDSL